MDIVLFFFFKQKTAYEMRISDWSSDVCSSDLPREAPWDRSRAVAAPGRSARGLVLERWMGTTAPPPSPSPYPATSTSLLSRLQIGRASCRERVCQYV